MRTWLLADVAGPLAPVVVDLEEALALAAHLEPVALAEGGLLGGGVLRSGAQGRLVLHHQRERRIAASMAGRSCQYSLWEFSDLEWGSAGAGGGADAEEAAREEAARLGRRDDHLDLVGQLVGEGLLDEQRVLGDERGVARHLLGRRPCP